MSNTLQNQPAPSLPNEEATHPCLDMLRLYAKLQHDGPVGALRRIELELAKPVECAKSPDDFPEPFRSALAKQLKREPPRIKQCHDNAWRICAFAGAPFELVTGYALSMIPMEHSWIRAHTPHGPIDFDPTDWALFDGKAFSHHLDIVSMDAQEARRRAAESRHSGPWRMEALMEIHAARSNPAQISEMTETLATKNPAAPRFAPTKTKNRAP